MSLLKKLANISPFRGMPIDNKGTSSSVSPVTGESVTLKYFNAGVLTNDAGQPAGTIVVAKLENNKVLNEIGDAEASFGNTSLAITSTALTTETQINRSVMEATDGQPLEERVSALAASLNNGEFVVDSAKGLIVGKKADNTTAVTAAYNVNQSNSGSGGGSSSGGSAAGGGLMTYLALPAGSEADGISAYASATTISVTCNPSLRDFTGYHIVEIKQIPTSGSVTSHTDLTKFSVSGTHPNKVITVSGATFAASDNFIVTLQMQPKAIDDDADAIKNSPQAADWTRNGSVETIFNALSTDTTVTKNVQGYKSLALFLEGSDTAALHATVTVEASNDGGTTFYPVAGHFISVTRNMSYVWRVNVAAFDYVRFNLDKIDVGAGTVSLDMIKAFEEAPNPQRTPLTNLIRESAALTASYATDLEIAIEGVTSFCVEYVFVTGATGGVDAWQPNVQIEVSHTRTGDNWNRLQVQSTSSGNITNQDATYVLSDGGAVFTSASTTYKGLVTAFSQNPGWKRIRARVIETNTPSNQGSLELKLTANSK